MLKIHNMRNIEIYKNNCKPASLQLFKIDKIKVFILILQTFNNLKIPNEKFQNFNNHTNL